MLLGFLAAAVAMAGCTAFMDSDEYAATLDCASFCAELADRCGAAEATCETSCAAWPRGEATNLSGDTLWCRHGWLARGGEELCSVAAVASSEACHDGARADCEGLCLFRVRSCGQPDPLACVNSCMAASAGTDGATRLSCALAAAADDDCAEAQVESCGE